MFGIHVFRFTRFSKEMNKNNFARDSSFLFFSCYMNVIIKKHMEIISQNKRDLLFNRQTTMGRVG